MTAGVTRQPACEPCKLEPSPAMAEKDKQRDQRLAAALRENLRRRKAQARDLAGPGAKDDANGGE